MEKRTHHYPQTEIQAKMKTVPEMNLTVSARVGLRAADMGQADALVVVQGLPAKIFTGA
ncbi:MAG: hypothetical protein HY777_14320 [Betaproteobacteria bacterium]|nr:hypothetical protein [Betaproteobacteria bacterium]